MTIGRPRTFDAAQVEDAATRLIWKRGFDGVSISDVTDATEVNRRSIYAEFGSKDNLFDRATRRYLAVPGSYMDDALTRSTAREVAELAMHGAADTVSGDIHGCLMVGDGPGLPELRDTVVHRLAERFTTAVDDGELAGVDPTLLARWVSAVPYGIAVQARSGASRADLHAVAEMAMTGWPGG